MSKFGPRVYKPAIGTHYQNHVNFGGQWYFQGGKKSDPKTYTVTMTAKGFTCDCPGMVYRAKCKHVEMIAPVIDMIAS